MNLYVVTGTTKGLGRALADAIVRRGGAELIEIARAPEGPVAGGFRFEADLADLDAVARACDRMEARIAPRSYEAAVLVNNAGVVGPVGPLETLDAGALARNLAVNLVAPLVLMQRFLAMTGPRARVRRVINISSGAGRRPVFGWSAYCASKAGLDMASRVAALEASARGEPVEVASLAPGVIDTDMQSHVRGLSPDAFADVERFRRMKLEGELRPAEDVAADILRAEESGRLAGEGVLDLRTLAG